jgi:cell fate regulator YaaT (PSP1 superfamily)
MFNILVVFNQPIKERNLPMKLVMIRYFFNEKKGIFYYTADGRIDFRQLVKDLAKEFKMRIEMRQVGVRDEAVFRAGGKKRLGFTRFW